MSNVTIENVVSLALKNEGLACFATPAISVIIPIFNHADYLPQCLASILSQKIDNFELICIDDCSTDGRISEFLSLLSSIPGIHCIRNESNLGISESQNMAVRHARGRYLAFIDCDDFLMPGALARVLSVIEENDAPDYLFTDRRNVNSNGEKLFDAVYKLVQSGRGIVEDLVDRMIASHLKIIRRDSFEKANGFSQRFSGIQDWELALEIAKFGRFIYLPEVLYCHRLHQASVTNSDHRGQAKKSNLLRRRHLEQVASTGDNNLNHQHIVTPFTVRQISGLGWYCPAKVASVWVDGGRCHLDATGDLSPTDIEFIVDFNSYFDRIDIDRVDVASQIVGSLWSPTTLRSPLHFSSATALVAALGRCE